MSYQSKQDEKPRLEQGTQRSTNMYLFGRGQNVATQFDDLMHLDMRTRIRGKNGARASWLFRILEHTGLSKRAASVLCNDLHRQAISYGGDGRKEAVAVLLGPQPMGQTTLQGYMDVMPPEWIKKKEG